MNKYSDPNCFFPDCTNRGYYRYSNGSAAFCSVHKEADMKPRKGCCQEPDCTKYASHGYDARTHCAVHKTNDMNLYRSLMCQTPDCNKHASYGYNRRTHCATHKTSDMKFRINIYNCNFTGCTNRGNYGHSSDPWLFCRFHKEAGMKPKKGCCQGPDCTKYASYGFEKRTHCATHKNNTMSRLK